MAITFGAMPDRVGRVRPVINPKATGDVEGQEHGQHRAKRAIAAEQPPVTRCDQTIDVAIHGYERVGDTEGLLVKARTGDRAHGTTLRPRALR